MCRSFARDATFIADPTGKSLDDYLSLFDQMVRRDVYMAAVYIGVCLVPSFVGQSAAPTSAGSSPYDVALSVLLATVAALWLVDAGNLWMLRAILIAVQAEGMLGTTLLAIWRRKHVCMASSSLALLVYAARVALEVYALALASGWIGILCGVALNSLIFALKVTRVLSLHSFGTWLGANWATITLPGDRDRPLVIIA